MRVRVIYAHSYHEGEDLVNSFIKGKKVIDIKLGTNYVDDEDHYTFLVMYE
ncbi:hypothetical protein J4439_08385 [Candidatus Woesearchaeota archaeon]|nr:hypothetical protein [Candidatus Woesearchaeota archaeon]